jgi:hypothetical protein
VDEEVRATRTLLESFRDPELWYGTDYGLALVLRSGALDLPTRVRLLEAIWQGGPLVGFVLNRQYFGEPWHQASAATAESDRHYGCISLGHGRILACYSGFYPAKEDDRCLIAIRMGMLERVYPIYDAHKRDGEWTVVDVNRELESTDVQRVLASVAARVYAQVPYELGVLSEEPLIFGTLEAVAPEVLVSDPRLLIPERFFARHGMTSRGVNLGEGLWWPGGAEMPTT